MIQIVMILVGEIENSTLMIVKIIYYLIIVGVLLVNLMMELVKIVKVKNKFYNKNYLINLSQIYKKKLGCVNGLF